MAQFPARIALGEQLAQCEGAGQGGQTDSQRPKLILLDEPVAGMTDAETERTAELCLELKKDHTLVVVEHDMSFIDTISEQVTVLAQGAILAEGTLAEVQANDDVIEKYLGR